MTQSAISHQIRTLEDYLQQPLFIRAKRKVILSDAGREMLAITDECLGTLARGLQRLEHYKKPNQLILHTSSAFASNWLVDRLIAFRDEFPLIDVWLYTTDMEPDLGLGEVHFAILYGNGEWPDLTATRLLDDVLIPVCAASHPILSLAQIEPLQLLDYDLLHGEGDENWHSWFAAHAGENINPVIGPNFSNPAHLIQTAASGRGIALASRVLATDLINTGQLACPLRLELPIPAGFYLATRDEGLKSKNMLPFRNWLISTANRFGQNSNSKFATEKSPG